MKKYNQEIEYYRLSDFETIVTAKIKEIILTLLEKNETINIALSGGSTPIPILKKLKDQSIDWDRVSFFLVDERCVPLQSPESNFGVIKQTFFDFISSKAFPMFKDLKTPAKEALEYEQKIKEMVPLNESGVPIFDLILLGMGGDGHIASLFPETQALEQEQRMVVDNHVPKLKSTRITVTYPIIMEATHRIMLIKGEEKISVLNELIDNESTAYPVDKLFRESYMTWFVGK